jgi:hypothetical protein
MSDQAHGYTIDDQRLAVQEARKVFEAAIDKIEMTLELLIGDGGTILAWDDGRAVCLKDGQAYIGFATDRYVALIPAVEDGGSWLERIRDGNSVAPKRAQRADVLAADAARIRGHIASLENALRERVERETPTVEQLKKIVEF